MECPLNPMRSHDFCYQNDHDLVAIYLISCQTHLLCKTAMEPLRHKALFLQHWTIVTIADQRGVFCLYSDFSGCKAGSGWDVTGRLPNKATRGEETWSSWHQRRLPRKLRIHLYCPLRTPWKPGDFGLKNEDSNCKLLLHLHGCNIWRIQRQFHVAKSPQAIRSPGHVLPLQWSCRCVSKPLRPADPHMDHSFVGFCWIFQGCPIFSGQMEAQSCSCSDFPPSKLGVNDLPYPHDV